MTSHTGSGTYPTKLLLQGLHLGSELRASCFCSSAQCTPVWLLLGLSFLSRWRSFQASFLSGLWTTGFCLGIHRIQARGRLGMRKQMGGCFVSIVIFDDGHRQVVARAELHGRLPVHL